MDRAGSTAALAEPGHGIAPRRLTHSSCLRAGQDSRNNFVTISGPPGGAGLSRKFKTPFSGLRAGQDSRAMFDRRFFATAWRLRIWRRRRLSRNAANASKRAARPYGFRRVPGGAQSDAPRFSRSGAIGALVVTVRAGTPRTPQKGLQFPGVLKVRPGASE